MAEVLTFEQYAARNGAGKWSFAEPGMHTRGHMSDAAHRRAMNRQVEESAQLSVKRETLRQEFAEKIKSGEIREPTRTEGLIQRANGHSDNASTQAARRICERRGITWQTNG